MTSVYIEASALFRRYTDEPGSDAMDKIVSLMESGKVTGQISLLSIPEILRGITKRKNLAELGDDEAQKIIDSILFDINTRVLNEELQILSLNPEYLPEVNQLIRYNHFYVIDAIQLITAVHSAAILFVHADSHFSNPLVESMIRSFDIRKPGTSKNIEKILQGKHSSG